MTNHDSERGGKAGLIAGATWGIITAVETVATPSPFGTVLILAILRVVWGFLLGLVFAVVADRFMPTRTYRIKGVVYGLILSVIEIVLNLANLSGGVAVLAVNLAVGIISSLVFGYILGYSYEKFGPINLRVAQEPGLADSGVRN